jgi:hypothetical protein
VGAPRCVSRSTESSIASFPEWVSKFARVHPKLIQQPNSMGKFAVAAGSIRYAAMVIGLTLAAIVLFSISVYEIHRDPCGVLLDRDGCLEFFRKKPLYENANLDAGLFYTSSRSEGLKWLRQEGSKVELAPTPLLAAVLEQAPAITIFVHGFRGVDSVDASYFQEMVSGIAGDRRFSGALIIYDWREGLCTSVAIRTRIFCQTD